jgi:hypothetical protein
VSDFANVKSQRTHEYGHRILRLTEMFRPLLNQLPIAERADGQLAVLDRHIVGNKDQFSLVGGLDVCRLIL